MMSEATARRPKSKRWKDMGLLEFRAPGGRTSKTGTRVWRRGPLKVLSELADLKLPGRDDGAVGPTWLVSASYGGRRCNDAQMGIVRLAFGMSEAEEDNHEPGIARKLFLVVAAADRRECDCKEDEDIIEEPDGYKWANPKQGPCRGCELQQVTGQLVRPRGSEVVEKRRAIPKAKVGPDGSAQACAEDDTERRPDDNRTKRLLYGHGGR